MIELPAGTPVGKYEIVRKIATGGMAEIYLARARGTAGFEKLVVLKRILPHLATDPTFVQMFLDEARLAATLQHPNIADVYDVGAADGAYFFTMEFVHGQDVRALRHAERARGQRVPLAIALAIVHGTLAALDYAHDKRGPDGRPLGIVHRDVSSSNVLVSYDGAIKLVDFGIARASSGQHKTRTGTLKGKIPYMSPEQARGAPTDLRSDLFSLGVVLYELTVGRRPFRGESDFAILEKIVHVGAVPPGHVVQGYPPELEAIVMRLLARDPAQRYTSGEAAMHDLEQVIAQHQLWVSPKAVGKYMRGLFATQITAWEQAVQQGTPLVDHLAATMTGQPRSDLLTPPSAFPAVSPPPGSSDDDDVVDDVEPMSYHSYQSRSTGVPTQAARPQAATPELRSSNRAAWFVVGVLVTAVTTAIVVSLAMHGRGEATATASAPAAAPQQPAVTPIQPAAAPKTPPTTTATTAPTTPTASTTPTTPTTPATPTTPTVATTPTHATTPSVHHVTTPPPSHPTSTKPTTTTQPAQWDPNSPFLPGQ